MRNRRLTLQTLKAESRPAKTARVIFCWKPFSLSCAKYNLVLSTYVLFFYCDGLIVLFSFLDCTAGSLSWFRMSVSKVATWHVRINLFVDSQAIDFEMWKIAVLMTIFVSVTLALPVNMALNANRKPVWLNR